MSPGSERVVDELAALMKRAARAVVDALADLEDWGPTGARPGEYRADLAADAAVVPLLLGAGISVWSEESGRSGAKVSKRPDLLAVVDPLDGSTNASNGLAYYATSIAILDDEGPLAAVVMNLANGSCYEAVRGGGAYLDGKRLVPSRVNDLPHAVVAFNGWPSAHLGWWQSRAMGSSALELCAVAQGALDGYVDLSERGLAPWDYLGAFLVCREAGAIVSDAQGRDLCVREDGARRAPIAAGTSELHATLAESHGRLAYGA